MSRLTNITHWFADIPPRFASVVESFHIHDSFTAVEKPWNKLAHVGFCEMSNHFPAIQEASIMIIVNWLRVLTFAILLACAWHACSYSCGFADCEPVSRLGNAGPGCEVNKSLERNPI